MRSHSIALGDAPSAPPAACPQVRPRAKSPALTNYGMEAEKDPRPLTTAEKATKVQKAKATRKARGTKGKRQKAAIRGEVPPATTGNGTPTTGS